MPRVKKGVTAHKRHKKILKLAKGYRGSKSKLFKKANETVMKALYYARRDRRAKKGDFVACGSRGSTLLPDQWYFLQSASQRTEKSRCGS